MATFRDRHGTHDKATIAKALQGHGREDHLCARPQAMARYACSHATRAACDHPLEAHLGTFADHRPGTALPAKPRPRARRAHAPHFDARDRRPRMRGVEVTVIEGLDATTAVTLLRDIGRDLRRVPRLTHVCRGLGVCPPHQISAGQLTSRHVRPGANRVAQALRLAARALHHAQTALGGVFRRLQSRMGTAQALTATAHTRARLV